MNDHCYVFLIIGAAVGFLAGLWLFAPSGPRRLPPPPPRPRPGVEPTRPRPAESLFARHVRHAAEALAREMNTEAATDDALDSAGRFISCARVERQSQRAEHSADKV